MSQSTQRFNDDIDYGLKGNGTVEVLIQEQYERVEVDRKGLRKISILLFLPKCTAIQVNEKVQCRCLQKIFNGKYLTFGLFFSGLGVAYSSREQESVASACYLSSRRLDKGVRAKCQNAMMVLS